MPMPDLPTNGHTHGPDEPKPERRPPLVPPHIAWPAFIVALLLIGVGSAFQALFAARSDGGARVVDDYGASAQEMETRTAALAASAALGWSADVALGECDADGCTVEVSVTDGAGAPVEGLGGTISARRPHDAAPLAETALDEAAPGVYRQRLALAPALWDLSIDATRGDDRFLTTVRREVR